MSAVNKPGNPWASTFGRLVAQRVAASAPVQARHNPRPPGVVRPGSAADRILTVLRSQPRRFFSREELIAATGLPEQSTAWPLFFLQRQELIGVGDDPRNPRYLRYRFRTGAGGAENGGGRHD